MKDNDKKTMQFPILRFKEFLGEWDIESLNYIAPNISSGKSQFCENGNYNLYGSTGIIGRCCNIDYNGEMLLIARVGANAGSIQIINDSCGITDNTLIIKSKDVFGHNTHKYLYYYLKTLNINKLAFGSGQPLITGTMLKKLNISFGVSAEIDKITTFLSLIDERIQTQIKIIEDLRLLKSVLLKKAFFQELRFPQFNENWKTIRLGDIGTFFSGGTPLTSMEWYYNGDIPFIKSGEINADCTEQFISEEGLKNSSAKMIEIGDLIYALYGATSGEVEISKIKGAINQAVLCIRTILNNIFLLNYLTFKKDEILRTYLQGGQGNLSAEIIKSLRVPMPINAEQTKLAYLFSAFDKKVELEINIMEKLKQQKQYFLANLFI